MVLEMVAGKSTKFWRLKTASFVIKLKKKSLGTGQKIGAGGGGQTNNFFCA